MTDQDIRLLCGEMNPSEMRLARFLCRYYERKIEAILDENALQTHDGELCVLSMLKKLAPNWQNNG